MARRKRFQIIWSWPDLFVWPWIGFRRFTCGLSCVYDWSAWLGPLEIRRWYTGTFEAWKSARAPEGET